MAQTGPLTNAEVQELVYDWFRQLTDKADPETLVAMLSADGLEMAFPERTLRSHADFRDWYEGVKKVFFDQVHDVKLLAIDPAADCSDVSLILNWQARTWQPPAAYSDHQSVYVHQNWTVRRDPQSGRAVIVRYHVGVMDAVRPV